MQWRTPITLVVLLVVVLGAAYYGWQTVISPVTHTSSSETTGPHKVTVTVGVCEKSTTLPKGTVVRSRSFKVNVFNSGTVSGKAGDVLSALHTKGFRIGIASNPPAGLKATNVTILTTHEGDPHVELVRDQFKGTVKVVPGPKLAPGVDVIIGNGFVGMNADAPESLTLKAPADICVKSVNKVKQVPAG